jgi:hypothetical protein
MNFLDFVAAFSLHNAWIREPGLQLYVRRAPSRPDLIDLATMDATVPGKGALTRFLDAYEPSYRFHIENVLNERLVSYLQRRGYVVINRECDGPIPLMQKPKA